MDSKVTILEKYLDDAQGALEDIVGVFTRERNPLPSRDARWFVQVGVFDGDESVYVGSALSEALERGRQATDDLASKRERLAI